MKKIFSLFAAVLFAGSIFAAGAKVTLDFTAAGWGFPTDYVTTAATYTNGGYSIILGAHTDKGHKAITSDGNVTALLFGKNGATLTLPAMGFNVSKIVVKGAAGSSGKVTFNIFVGENAVSTEAKGSTEDHEFAIAAGSQTAGTVYVIKLTNANNCQISAVEFYEAVAGAPKDPTFSIPGAVYGGAQSVELACETEGATIHYTLDGTDPTDASAEYSSAINIAVTTTIKAIAVKNSISSDIVSATYKIVELDGVGTKANPYSVTDVAKLENTQPAAAWVQGYICGGSSGSTPLSIDNTKFGIILLGITADATEFIPVQLIADTDPRAALNAADNPGNIGKLVKVHGTLELYCTTTGVKGTDDFEIVSTTAIDNTAVENKAVKTIENGMIVIEKNGVRYNVIGQVIR